VRGRKRERGNACCVTSVPPPPPAAPEREDAGTCSRERKAEAVRAMPDCASCALTQAGPLKGHVRAALPACLAHNNQVLRRACAAAMRLRNYG
jgi:hypothetical protein